MNANDLDLDHVDPIDRNSDALKPGSTSTPLSTLIWAIAAGDLATVESQVADGIEWGLMPYNKVLKGKAEVMPWFKAAVADKKRPVVVTNAFADGWGVLEYWNIGTVSEDVIRLGNERTWPWPGDPQGFLGREYRVAQCFVYRVDGEGRIELMRQYLDPGSIWAQLAK